jgi:uncharacterized membrane protein
MCSRSISILMGSCVSDFIHKVVRLYILNNVMSGVVKYMVLFDFLRMLGKVFGGASRKCV